MLSPGAADCGAGGSAWSAPNGDSSAVEKGDARSGADARACPRGQSLAALGACRSKSCVRRRVRQKTRLRVHLPLAQFIAEGTNSKARHGVMHSIFCIQVLT